VAAVVHATYPPQYNLNVVGAMESGNSSVVRFGVFEMDLAARELRRSGVRVRLQDQPFRVLALLVERPGEIVTREEIKDAIWAEDTFVEFDHGLNTVVQKIRQALGDSATSARFLETVPRRGYRFVALVEASAGTEVPADSTDKPSPIEPDGRDWRRALPWALVLALSLAWTWAYFARSTESESNRAVRRFTIVPELAGAGVYSRAAPGGIPAAAAISPDGTQIAYFSAEDPPRLWLHTLSSGESKPIDGTESGVFGATATASTSRSTRAQTHGTTSPAVRAADCSP